MHALTYRALFSIARRLTVAARGNGPGSGNQVPGDDRRGRALPGVGRAGQRPAALRRPRRDTAPAGADLERRIAQLSAYLDAVKVGNGTGGTTTVDEYVRLVALHGQLCSRVGRLMRDQQQLRGEDDSELQAVMNEALDLAGEILGLEI